MSCHAIKSKIKLWSVAISLGARHHRVSENNACNPKISKKLVTIFEGCTWNKIYFYSLFKSYKWRKTIYFLWPGQKQFCPSWGSKAKYLKTINFFPFWQFFFEVLYKEDIKKIYIYFKVPVIFWKWQFWLLPSGCAAKFVDLFKIKLIKIYSQSTAMCHFRKSQKNENDSTLLYS